ncbi:hypothetical protein J3Q64DRAFT_1647836, partial [Phycomyces blakesleeanus]
ILTACPERYWFRKNSIYYNFKPSPHNHFLALFCIAQLLEQLGYKSINCFSLRRSWSPCYMQIDTRILCQQILRTTGTAKLDKLELCGRTDGVGVSFLTQTQGTTKGPTSRRASIIKTENIYYVHNCKREQHERICGRCVFINPGRSDLLYCIHEDSTV